MTASLELITEKDFGDYDLPSVNLFHIGITVFTLLYSFILLRRALAEFFFRELRLAGRAVRLRQQKGYGGNTAAAALAVAN